MPLQSSGWSTSDSVSTLIAVMALLLTVASFWWMNSRRGKLQLVGIPRSFAVSTASKKLHLNVPLSLYNSGPTPVWATNLKLRLSTPGLPEVVHFVATRPGVQPQTDEERPMATQMALAGRESRVICCEFIERGSSTPLLVEGSVPVEVLAIETRTWGRQRERVLGTFDLLVTADTVATQDRYIVRDNFD